MRTLPYGSHAMVETHRAFYLLLWQSAHVQTKDKCTQGRVLSGGDVDWGARRSRGIGQLVFVLRLILALP